MFCNISNSFIRSNRGKDIDDDDVYNYNINIQWLLDHKTCNFINTLHYYYIFLIVSIIKRSYIKYEEVKLIRIKLLII
jgi:hypothetical protein